MNALRFLLFAVLVLLPGSLFAQGLGSAGRNLIFPTRTNVIFPTNALFQASIYLSDGYRITTQADLGSGGGGATNGQTGAQVTNIVAGLTGTGASNFINSARLGGSNYVSSARLAGSNYVSRAELAGSNYLAYLSPWTGNIDAAGYALGDVSGVYRVGTFNLGADVGIAYFTNSLSLGYGAAGSEVEYLAITSSGLKILPTGSPGSGKFLTADADGYVSWATPSGGGSQTPWTATINGAGYPATNIGSLQVTGPITSASLNITTLSQGFTSLTVAAVTAVTVEMGSKLEIWATNNLAFTNWTGIAGTNANDAVVFIYPKTNITVTWPAFKTGTLGAYFGTNANAPMLTTLINGEWYILTAGAIRTNVALALSRF